ncbi:Rap1a/Tai family immunity protein [Paraburkholderia sp. MM6662-R1]|uniref:Rap1a/Tai family immunity protein n=1 Tax=Paraburkholderia sp. MM6662-R1 TaxID=2991066 RepID=UPI003D192F97
MNSPNRLSIAACLAFAAIQPVSASPTGEELLRACNAVVKQLDGAELSQEDMASGLWCTGYLSGFVDAVALTPPVVLGQRAVCLPTDGVSGGQLARIVTKWLREHPEHLHESGRTETLLALSWAFPCQ